MVIMILNEKIRYIETTAWELILEAYANSQIVPPIDVLVIAKNLGLEVKFGKFKEADVDGAFMRSEKTIYANEQAPYTRQAFTIAHELGHYLLHEDKDQEKFYRRDMLKFNDDKEQEQEANWFAAALLMPRRLVSHYCGIYNTVGEISNAFMVSYSAAYWRLKNLGYLNV